MCWKETELVCSIEERERYSLDKYSSNVTPRGGRNDNWEQNKKKEREGKSTKNQTGREKITKRVMVVRGGKQG